MIETTIDNESISQFNESNLPPAGSPHIGKFFNEKIWEPARKEKIEKLGLHQRWIDLHAQYRGRRKRRTYPRIGVNYIFKQVEIYCAMMTEKIPIAELTADNADDPIMTQAFDSDAKTWWKNSKQQFLLRASTQNMQIYGTTIEKAAWSELSKRCRIIVRDVFNFFPAPGYTLCDLDIPYVCDVDFMHPWQIKQMFGLPEETHIPPDADEQLAGTIRQTTRGGKQDSDTLRNYPTNYSAVAGPQSDENLKQKTMVVEIWIRDNTIVKEPVMASRPAIDPMGRPIMGEDGLQQQEEYQTGEVNEYAAYPDGIRKITICPALLNDEKIKGVLDDSINPNINWKLLEMRIQSLVEQGLPQPAVDPSGNPVVDPITGKPAMQLVPVTQEQAQALVMARARLSFPLWGQFPYSANPSRIDTSQWWGFSTKEQIEELQGKHEMMLTKYLIALERQMFPILVNTEGSGVQNSEFSNDAGLVINPTVATSNLIRYVDPPSPPSEYLEAMMYISNSIEDISQTPAVMQGQRPTGISAAAAIVALQDKASTLTTPQIQQIDALIGWRGKAMMHFHMNFDFDSRQVMVEGQPVLFRGTDLFTNFNYIVESGSSAPITKAGRRQQYVELFKLGAMDLESLLTFLEIPNSKLIVERITEQNSLPGALKILAQAGVPPEILAQLYQVAMQQQYGVKNVGGTTMKTAEDKAGGYSEGINAAKQGMSEIGEG